MAIQSLFSGGLLAPSQAFSDVQQQRANAEAARIAALGGGGGGGGGLPTTPIAPPPVPLRRRASLFDPVGGGMQDDPFALPENIKLSQAQRLYRTYTPSLLGRIGAVMQKAPPYLSPGMHFGGKALSGLDEMRMQGAVDKYNSLYGGHPIQQSDLTFLSGDAPRDQSVLAPGANYIETGFGPGNMDQPVVAPGANYIETGFGPGNTQPAGTVPMGATDFMMRSGFDDDELGDAARIEEMLAGGGGAAAESPYDFLGDVEAEIGDAYGDYEPTEAESDQDLMGFQTPNDTRFGGIY